jgi:DNA polymerase-1
MYLKRKADSRYIVLDVEANGLKPTKLWCLVWAEIGQPGYHQLVGQDAITKFWADVVAEGTIVIGHNAISYDVPVLNRLTGHTCPSSRVVDTQVLGFLYAPKLAGGHSLAAWGERFGIEKVGTDIEQWDVYEPIMLLRCVSDVKITERLYHSLYQKMGERGYSELSCQIEHMVREAVDEQEDHGFYFDLDKAFELYGNLNGLVVEYEKEVYKLFPPELRRVKTCVYKLKKDGTEGKGLTANRAGYPKVVVREQDGEYDCYDYVPFNLGSPAQRVSRLTDIGYVAINFTKKTKKGGGGNPQVDEDGLNAFLEECSEDVKPAVEALTKWLVASSRWGMVTTWLKSVAADGAIHGTVWTCGAGSRRCTHTGPNTANIPGGEAPYGHECRALWRARPGRVLVGCDAKAIQMRMFAHRLGNLDVGMQYVEGDPHQRNADAALIPRKKVKNCFYAMIFGAQDMKLGKTAHGGSGTAAQGSFIRTALYQTTPGLEDLFAAAEASYNNNNGWMQLIDGGWVRCPSPHAALNYWIQGDEAVLMKMTVIRVRNMIRKEKLDAFQVGFIHDEVQYDCAPECAARVAEIFKEAIAFCGAYLKFIVPMAGDSKEGPTWAETH